jgi:hypothetical protein
MRGRMQKKYKEKIWKRENDREWRRESERENEKKKKINRLVSANFKYVEVFYL